jgi:hypothetical protein
MPRKGCTTGELVAAAVTGMSRHICRLHVGLFMHSKMLWHAA